MSEQPDKRPGPGRPPWQPTEQQRGQVKDLAARGVPEQNIAVLLGVDKKTLRTHCMDEIQAGRSVAIANVLGSLYAQAQKGEFKHQQLYLANTIGWQIQTKVELAGGVQVSERIDRARRRAMRREQEKQHLATGAGVVMPDPEGDGDAG